MPQLTSLSRALALLTLLPLLHGCTGDGGTRAEQSTSPSAQEPMAEPTSQPAPAAPAATERPQADAPAPPLGQGPLEFTAQEGWVVEQPANSMRAAQYRLPGEGDADDAELVIFHFGSSGGGGFEANLARWAGQFELPDGGSPLAAVRQSSREVQGMGVREVELEGTYVAETMPGSGQRLNEPGWALRAAVIDAPTGPYYAKLVGPEPTVERWEASYRAFISAVRPGQ